MLIPMKDINTNGPGIGSLPKRGGEAISRKMASDQKTIQTIENAEDAMIKIRDQQERNTASIFITEKLSALKAKAVDEKNFNSFPDYEKEIAKIGADASQNISGNVAREDFMKDFNVAAITTKYHIQDLFRTKQIDAAQANLALNIQTLQNDYIEAADEHEKTIAAMRLKKSIEDNVTAGVISHAEGVKQWKQSTKEMFQGEIKAAALQDPEGTYAELKKGKEGRFGEMDAKDRAGMEVWVGNLVTKYKKEEEKRVKDTRDILYQDSLSKLFIRDLRWEDIEDMEKIPEDQGGLDKKQIETLKRGYWKANDVDMKEIIGSNKYAEKYVNLVEKFLSGTDARKAKDMLVDAFSDGEIDGDESVKLNNIYTQLAQKDKANSMKNLVPAIQGIMKWTKSSVEGFGVPARMIYQLINHVANGEDPLAVAEVLKKQERLNLRPQISNAPKKGQLMMDGLGNKAIVYPDGDIEDYAE